jgi:hypothetical protein
MKIDYSMQAGRKTSLRIPVERWLEIDRLNT